jgi:hypothetical protein
LLDRAGNILLQCSIDFTPACGPRVTWGSIGGTNTLTSGDVLTIIGGGDATLANLGLTIAGSY